MKNQRNMKCTSNPEDGRVFLRNAGINLQTLHDVKTQKIYHVIKFFASEHPLEFRVELSSLIDDRDGRL